MKKEWSNPEVKNLGIENTNENVCNTEICSVGPIWHCLTHGAYFETYQDLQNHIQDIEHNGKYHEVRAS